MSNFHEPVLLDEVIDFLQIKKNTWYVDATLGGGGHTSEILDNGGNVLGIDQDTEALDYVKQNLESRIDSSELKLVHGNFRDLKKFVESQNIERVGGILFDLGISSHQVDSGERGFSFQEDAPLDMRMDKSLSVNAADLVNGLSKDELILLFRKYGEEVRARGFAEKIVAQRKISPIQTTRELAQLLGEKKHFEQLHPATKVFQALRIAVNDELHSIEEALPQALEILEQGGRIVVISFHSLEDRIIKHRFLDFENKGYGKVITKKPVLPGTEELSNNRRARSAKLRVFEKK